MPAFFYTQQKDDRMSIYHHDKLVFRLKGPEAIKLIARLESADEAEAQRLMARATGNYKRGNEKR